MPPHPNENYPRVDVTAAALMMPLKHGTWFSAATAGRCAFHILYVQSVGITKAGKL